MGGNNYVMGGGRGALRCALVHPLAYFCAW